MLVQTQRGVIAHLGVDHDAMGVQPPQPMKAVQEQPLPEPVALRFRLDRETLDEPASVRCPTDGVPDNLVPHTQDNPQMPLLGCPQCVAQAGSVQAPKRGEGGGVDLEHPLAAERPGAVQRRPRRNRWQGYVLVKGEQVEVFVHVEAGLEEAPLLVRGQSAP